MKKLYFLLVAMFLGIFSAQAARVYFQNTANWPAVAAHMWPNGGTGTSWPGTVITNNKITATNGTVYYYVDVPSNYNKIIFNNNNNGQQTKDLNVIDNAVYSYAQNNNGSSGTIDPIGSITQQGNDYVFTKAGEVVLTPGDIYFPVSNYNKSKAFMYTWNAPIAGNWPGTQMTKVTLSNGEFWKLTIADDREITNVTVSGWQFNTGDSSDQLEFNKSFTIKPGDCVDLVGGTCGPVADYKGSDTKVPDWYGVWYNILGGYNNWDTNTEGSGYQMNNMDDPIATWTGQKIGTTGFKVKAWINSQDVYYSVGGPVTVGKWISCPVDANNAPEMTVTGASADATFDVKFNVETNEIFLTLVSGTIDEGGQGGEDPGTTDYTKWTVNICGDWNDNTTYGDGSIYTTPTEEGIATFENLENLYQGFQIKTWDGKEDKWYNQTEGAIATDTWVVLGNAFGSVVNIEGATEKSIYTIEFDCKNNSVRATLVSGGDTPTAPESIYIIGAPAGVWAPNQGLEIKGTNGVYTTTLDFDATSYFGFATQLTEGDSQEDWFALNEKYRIGAIENNSSTNDDHYLVSADQLTLNSALELGFKYPGTTSWGLPAGKYNVSLSWDNKQISITPTELRDEPVVATEFYLTGDFINWNEADETYKFTQVDDSNVYTLSLESLPAGAEFKITNGSWDLSFGGEGEYGKNDPVNAVIGNNNMWKNSVNLIAGDWINIKFTFTYNENTDVASILNIEATEVALPDDKVTYAVVGPIFQDNVQSMDMTLDGTTATLTATVQKQTFRIQKLVNGEVTATYGPTGAGDIINPGEYTGKEIDANGTPWVFSAVIIPEATADLEFSFDTESMVLTISKVETPEPAGEELYIVGEGTINGTTLGWTPTSPLTVEGKDGVYTFSVKGGTKFQISTEKADWDEGYNKNGLCFDGRQNSEVQSSDINNPIKLYWGWAQDIVMPTNHAEYTVTVTLKGNVGGSESTMLIVPVGEVSYPETMYVIGNVNGEESWIPTNGYAMTKTADGVFKVTEMGLTRSAASEYAYFSFAESLATAEGAWDTMGQRYGAAANEDYKLNGDANETAPIRAGETAFMIQIDPGATITMTLDFTTMQLTVDSTTMVDNVVVDGNDAPVYYNLQGVRVDNPAAGLYIVVRGNNVTKEVIR